jgi:hypothetical protein
MKQHQYEESCGRWEKARAKRSVIDALKMVAALGSLVVGLLGTFLYLFANYPH